MNESFFDDMIFGASPIAKLLDILKHANTDIANNELEKFVLRTAVVEAILESKGVSEQEIAVFFSEKEEIVRELANSLAVSVTADILTQNE